MSRIVWDEIGKRFFELGVSQGVLYPQATTGAYEKGVGWSGLTAINETPSGAEPNDLYADNIKYASLRSAETWGATIEAFFYPPEFNECNGSKKMGKGMYVHQQDRSGFGLCYRTEIGNDTATSLDDGYVLHLCYGCTAAPSERNHGTINESPDAGTMSWDVNSIPVNVGMKNPETGKQYKPCSTITVESLDFVDNPEILEKLENILYGTENTEPRLPLPKEVYEILYGIPSTPPAEDLENTL